MHYKELAEDKNPEFCQTCALLKYKTVAPPPPPVHDELLGIMSFPHGGRKYVNGGQHLVEAIRIIREEHASMKLKPWMYKFRNKLMRVCHCVCNGRETLFQTGIHCIRYCQ